MSIPHERAFDVHARLRLPPSIGTWPNWLIGDSPDRCEIVDKPFNCLQERKIAFLAKL